MATELNINPYYDDFDEFKNFHQLLFKPGFAVQARELTQIQSILQNQIAKFGSHIFKHGSVVIPGNTLSELYVAYVKLETLFNGVVVEPENFVDKIVVGLTSGVKAKVRTYANPTSTDPLTFYLAYVSGGGETQSNVFLPTEIIALEEDQTQRVTVQATTPTGVGSIAIVKQGVYFVNGKFVSVSDQIAVISKYSSAPSCSVYLKIDESIVTSNEDSTLLDPAQGSYNFAAPGADRLKVTLTLTSLPLNSIVNDDYIEIMRFNNGILELHSRYPSYSELEKNLARRTFDQSGNYLVSGYRTNIREHLKTSFNNGLYLASNPVTPGDAAKFVVEVDPGKAYINGLEREIISRKILEVDKARTTQNKNFDLKANYGKYVYVSGLTALPEFLRREQVNLYNVSSSTGGTLVGTLRVVGIDFYLGDQTSDNSIYKLYIDSLEFADPAYTLQDVGSLRFTNGTAIFVNQYEVPSASKDFSQNEIVTSTSGGVTRRATVRYYSKSLGVAYVHKHVAADAIPVKGDFITGATSGATATVNYLENINGNANPLIFTLPKSYVKTLGIGTSYNTELTVWKTFNVDLDGDGVGSFSITDSEFVTPEVGTLVAISDASPNVVPITAFSLQTTTTLDIDAGATYANATVYITAQIRKNGSVPEGQPKTKTKTPATLTGVTPATEISLGKTDIYNIISIVSTVDGDVTDRYTLDNGQTDYYYGLGKILLRGVLPTGTLTIQFEYFEHSGAGDYFSIDSYKTLGTANDLYISLAPIYVSRTTSKKYFLGNCLDFRPNMNVAGNFNTSTTENLVVDSFVSTNAQYYIPRMDLLYVNQSGMPEVRQGNPSEEPLMPFVPENSIALAAFYVSAYTERLNDIYVKKFNNYRYTMNDIGGLEKRVTDLEYYTQLNSLESSILSYDIVDAETGLNKFKSGYIVDNFKTYNLVCDYFNSENRCSFWSHNLSAPTEDYEGLFTVLEGSSTNYTISNGILTLPYTEQVFIKQGVSSRVENLNPFLVFSWEGSMTIEPSSDVWIETQDLPTIFNSTSETVEVVVRRVINVPAPEPVWEPPPPPPAAPPPPPAPAVPPPPPATVTIGAFAGDLGLVSDINDPNWRDVVFFEVPANIGNVAMPLFQQWQTEAAPQVAATGAATLTDTWAAVIATQNELFNSAVSSNIGQLGLTTSGRNNVNQIFDQVETIAAPVGGWRVTR